MKPVLKVAAAVEGVAILALAAWLALREPRKAIVPASDAGATAGRQDEPSGTPPGAGSDGGLRPRLTVRAAGPTSETAADSIGTRIAPGPAPEDAAEDAAGVVVCGTVSGPALVRRTCRLKFDDGVSNRIDVVAGPRGGYAASGFHAGRWNVTADADGTPPYERSFEIPPGVAVHRHDVVLGGGRMLEVRLLAPDGRPLGIAAPELPRTPATGLAIDVIATAEPVRGDLPPSPHGAWHPGVVGQWRRASPAEFGERRIPGAIPGVDGVLVLSADLPLHVAAVLGHVVLDTKLVPAGATRVDLRIDPGRLEASHASARVRIVDAATRAPLGNVLVTLDRGGRLPNLSRADADGAIVFRRLRPGFATLRIRETGYQWVEETVVLEPGRELDLGVVALAAEAAIEGRVVDAEGDPYRCRVRIQPLVPPLAGGPFPPALRAFETFADGSFTIPGNGRGRHLLVAADDAAGLRAEAEVDTTSGPVRDLEVRLAPASRVTLAFTVETGEGRTAVVTDASGRQVWSAFVDGSRRHGLALARGRHRLDLFRGAALVRAIPIDAGEEPAEVPVEIAAGR